MNKKIAITQRADLVADRQASTHAPKPSFAREQEHVKQIEPFYLHQSGAFTSRNRTQTQNKPQHLQRILSLSTPPHPPEFPLLLLTELSKSTKQTQQKLCQLTLRLDRLQSSFHQFKTSYPQSLSKQVETSLDELLKLITEDLRKSEENLIKHVQQQRGVTQKKLEEIKRDNGREIVREVGRGVDQIREEMSREGERVREKLEGVLGRVQKGINEMGVGDCIVTCQKGSRANMIRFLCSAKPEFSLVPIPITQYSYFITSSGELTDCHGYLITDSTGQPITLLPQHLQKLRQAGLLQ